LSDSTKGKRDERIPLHGAVIGHLRPLQASETHEVFQCESGTAMRQLYKVYHRIQDKAGVSNCGKNGGDFGFHDLRRGFATANAEHMDLFELQKLMQHRSLETTRGYVNMAGKLKKAIEKVHVPEFLAVRETFTRQADSKVTGE
jgi:integrase